MSMLKSRRDITEDQSACFPFSYFRDFLKFLHQHRDVVQVTTYAELAWTDDSEDFNYEDNYLSEFNRWKQKVANAEIDPEKIYLVLQHDVDDCPDRSLLAAQEEAALGLHSNIMIFNRRVDRNVLRKEGLVQYNTYDVDHQALQRLEAEGFVIGYHSNAYEQAGFDLESAEDIFVNDVKDLRSRYEINFFCPHGGATDGNGKSNAILPLPESERHSLRWTLNGHTIRFNGVYSDGAINSTRRDPTSRDLRDFVGSWRRGRRYRILLHPQYYHTKWKKTKALTGVHWYESVVRCETGSQSISAWNNVELRPDEAKESKNSRRSKPKMTELALPPLESRPIFIGGDGRSGTTLLNVILDSHPSLSVGTELHFNGKMNLGPYVLDCIDLIEKKDPRTIGKALGENPDIKPGVQFVRRVQRAGFQIDELQDCIKRAIDTTNTVLDTFYDRCVLIDFLGRLACDREHTDRWGFKIMREIRNIQRYALVWPEAHFIHIIRDGRDVAASQMLEHGSWGYDNIASAADGWCKLIRESRQNAEGKRLFELRYEDLALRPEETLRELLIFLEVEWHPQVLQHEQADHAFFHTHVKHPSRDQTMQPINSTAIGRYKRDFDVEQIRVFEQVAAPMLSELGYDISGR